MNLCPGQLQRAQSQSPIPEGSSEVCSCLKHEKENKTRTPSNLPELQRHRLDIQWHELEMTD